MDFRDFGTTGIKVSALGFGAGTIGDASIPEAEVDMLLNSVLDEGINLIDTARGYGLSEERIGRHLSRRRSEYVLSTKIGYGLEGIEDWTFECIIAGVEEALGKLQTDFIDIVHLHSCSIKTLQDGQVSSALEEVVKEGKVRIDRILHIAKNKGMGFIAKRPIANAPWRFRAQPVGHYCEEYWKRWQTMDFDFDMDETELAGPDLNLLMLSKGV